MKIAIDAYHTLYPSGGIARYSRGLIGALAEAAPGARFTLFVNRFREKGPAWTPDRENVSLREVFFPRRLLTGLWDAAGWPAIESFLGDIDIFHGLHFVLPPARKAKRVLTVHDLTYLRFPHYFADRRLNERGYRHELQRGLERADAVIAVSESTRRDLIELTDYPGERIRTIHEGVSPHFFEDVEPSSADRTRKRYGIPDPYIVFLVGTPEPRKNLLRTVTAVHRAAPDCTIVLIGPQKPLEDFIGHPSPHVVFTGVVADGELPAILSGARLSDYPTLYEGFGLPVLESMACGVPVVTSDRGSLPEIAGGAALLVNPEDIDDMAQGISDVLDDDSLQGRLKMQGRKRAEAFTWQKTASETFSLYRDILSCAESADT